MAETFFSLFLLLSFLVGRGFPGYELIEAPPMIKEDGKIATAAAFSVPIQQKSATLTNHQPSRDKVSPFVLRLQCFE